jgi:hypothetical protein
MAVSAAISVALGASKAVAFGRQELRNVSVIHQLPERTLRHRGGRTTQTSFQNVSSVHSPEEKLHSAFASQGS